MPLYIDNMSALHVAGNHTYSPRAKYIALRYYCLVQKLVKGKISIHCVVKSKGRLGDLGTKHLRKNRHRNIIKLASMSLRFKTPKTHHFPEGGHHLPAPRIPTYCSQCLAHFVVIYRGARTLHCSFVVGSSH